jgi:hypothetical protein
MDQGSGDPIALNDEIRAIRAMAKQPARLRSVLSSRSMPCVSFSRLMGRSQATTTSGSRSGALTARDNVLRLGD